MPRSATSTDGRTGTARRLGGPLDEGLSQAVGANYHLSAVNNSLGHWINYDPLLAEEQIGFLAANGINTIRTFLNFEAYERDPGRFLEDLTHYALQMASHRILFMAVLFDSFGLEPSGDPVADADSPSWIKTPATSTITAPDFLSRATVYIAAVVQVVNQAIADSGEQGVWWIADVWNEPALQTVTYELVGQLLEAVQAQADAPDTTVGFGHFPQNEGLLESLADHTLLTIISGHPYGTFEEVVTHTVQDAQVLGDAYGGKPVFISEVGLPGLFQYYGSVLKWIETAGVGFALWEAFVGNDQFQNLTGIFYPEAVADGLVTVRSTTAANALWALARRRDPAFVPPYIAVEKDLVPGYVSLGPALINLSTGDYHALLLDYEAHYGSVEFPLLSISEPYTGTLYTKLMTWTFLSFGKILTVDGATRLFAQQNLATLQQQYDLGNLAQAEIALVNLFNLASQLMTDNDLGEPENYPPEVLHSKLETTLNPDLTTFDAHFETAVFDVNKDDLSTWLFVHDILSGDLFELPMTRIPLTTAWSVDVPAIPLTHGREYELGVFVADGSGGNDLLILRVTMP